MSWKDSISELVWVHAHIKNLLVEDKPNYIFLDEIQNIKEFQRLVDSLYINPNVDIYITGSNAYMLSGELATLLTGRYVEINLLPLQFAEYNDFIHLKLPNLSNNETLANFLCRVPSGRTPLLLIITALRLRLVPCYAYHTPLG